MDSEAAITVQDAVRDSVRSVHADDLEARAHARTSVPTLLASTHAAAFPSTVDASV